MSRCIRNVPDTGIQWFERLTSGKDTYLIACRFLCEFNVAYVLKSKVSKKNSDCLKEKFIFVTL